MSKNELRSSGERGTRDFANGRGLNGGTRDFANGRGLNGGTRGFANGRGLNGGTRGFANGVGETAARAILRMAWAER